MVIRSSSHGSHAVLEAEHVSKRYRGASRLAVNDVSFAVSRGEIVGLLGPNGAGKSTMIGIITTRLLPDQGEIRIASTSTREDPAAARVHIGVTGQSNTLDGSCTVHENLFLHLRYHGLSRDDARRRATVLLEELGLAERARDMPATLSGGLARRLQLARAMAHGPALLLLDEPTNELDVPGRTFFWERLHRVRAEHQAAVLLATHQLDEAEEHCDRVLILDAGRIVAEGTPAELRRRFRGTSTVEITLERPLDEAASGSIAALPGVVRCTSEGRRVTVLLDSSRVPLGGIAAAIEPFGVEELATRTASLREIFLDVVAPEEERE